ncbi:hypothetical protein WR25_27267 [Diploscapter pachys]|uniref:Uncharacterized protein n=1 Tax=Diploscapter pachys TaxID=2018661 RepID=A0A2A2KJ68_9BILA|nr:hypothetical protein WR25_27267 [Diploscapter pachys]
MLQQLSVSSQSSRGTSSAAPTSILKRPSSTSKQESETPNKRPTKHEVVVEKSNSAPRHMNLSNEKELTQKTPASSGRQNPKSEAMNCQICKTPLIVHSCGGHVEVHLSKVFKIHLFTCGFDGCTYGHYARRKITAHMIEVHKDKNEAKVIKNMSRKYYRRWKECLFKCCPSKEIAESIVEKREAYLRQIGREDCLEDEPEFEGNVEQNDDEKDDDTKSNGSNEDDESSGQEEET